VAGGWKRVQNEVLHNLQASPDIRGMKSRRKSLAGNLERIGGM
jgi:hypothetical protein